MPSIKRFEIRNFKGVKKTSISLDDRTDNPVITLIGLNESGKTTILEALSYFVSNDPLVSSLFKPKAKTQHTEAIPISSRADFSDNIEIEALVELDDHDLMEIEELCASRKLKANLAALKRPIIVNRRLTYTDSTLTDSRSIWDLDLYCSEEGEEEFKKQSPQEKGDIWYSTVALIQAKLPSIAYFPTFLVDIPNKIYLTEHNGETPANQHYRSIFQSIMEQTGDGLDIERHITGRIKSYAHGKQANWTTQFTNSNEKTIINSVFVKVSNTVTKEVIGGWRRVFSKETTAKSITIDWNIDTSKNNTPYISFMVSDGESRYDISERSLGFRWFFSFLLFTAFKGDSNKKTIWIFDEPAANLHAKAQAELLKSFEKIATEGSKVIYSTHSHHMINPKWLGGAYIVENTALNPDAEDTFEFNTAPTDIKATKYKEFLANYPTRSSYFQPVIESLEYITPEIISQPPFVLVEGISDYYALMLAQKHSKINLNFRLIPGVGSGASGPLISLMMGRGEQFVVLLDDDAAGRKECKRYQEEWYLNSNNVCTLVSVDTDYEGMALENLLDSETKDLIVGHKSLATTPTKKQIGWYLAEACAATNLDKQYLSAETLKNLCSILEFLNSKTRSNI